MSKRNKNQDSVKLRAVSVQSSRKDKDLIPDDSTKIPELVGRRLASYKFLIRKFNKELLQKIEYIRVLEKEKQFFRALSDQYFSSLQRKVSQLKDADISKKKLIKQLEQQESHAQRFQESLACVQADMAAAQHLRESESAKLVQINAELMTERNIIFADLEHIRMEHRELLEQHALLELNYQESEQQKKQQQDDIASQARKIAELEKHLSEVEKLADNYWNRNKRMAEKIESLSSSLVFNRLYKEKIIDEKE